MRWALLVVLIGGCAADAGAPRWHHAPLTLCAPPDVPTDALLYAAGAWSAHGPAVGVVLQYPCDISVRWGEPSRGVASERKAVREGAIVFSAITLLDGERWGDAAADPHAYDLQAVLTHEIGHALGLPHLPDPAAAMFDEVAPGDVRPRTLSAADVEAIGALY